MDGLMKLPLSFVFIYFLLYYFCIIKLCLKIFPIVKLQKSYISQKCHESFRSHCCKRQMGETSVLAELKGIKGCNGYILKSIRCKRTSLGIVSFNITFL